MKVFWGVIAGACLVQGAWAASVVERTVTYTYIRDEGSQDESCLTYLDVKITGEEGSDTHHRFCGGGEVRPVISMDDDVVFVDLMGGSGAGWGLYRYNMTKDKVDFYDFDAREIYIGQKNARGVYLYVYYENHLFNKHGGYYGPDKITKWYWAFDKDKPVRMK